MNSAGIASPAAVPESFEDQSEAQAFIATVLPRPRPQRGGDRRGKHLTATSGPVTGEEPGGLVAWIFTLLLFPSPRCRYTAEWAYSAGMGEILFDRTTRPRARRGRLAWSLLVPAFGYARLQMSGQAVVGYWVAGSLLLLLVTLWLMSRSAWTRIGPEGISCFPGYRRVRTLPWSEVGWIGVRSSGSRQRAVRIVRVTDKTGKRFNLPCLGDSYVSPDPDFDRKVEQVTSYWQAHTDGLSRIEPGPSRGDARLAALDSFNRNPSRGFWRFARSGWCQAALGLLFAVLTVHSLSEIPGDHSAAVAYQNEALCPSEPVQQTECINREAMFVGRTVIGSGPLAESRLYLSYLSYRPEDSDSFELDFGTATPWLRSLHPNEQVYVDDNEHVNVDDNGPGYADSVDDGEITDVGVGGVMVHDAASPAYFADTETANALCFGAIALFLGIWSAGLFRSRYGRVRVRFGRRFRWWVPCSLPAVAIAIVIDNHLDIDPSPLRTGYLAVPALALAVGLALALGLSRVRLGRGPATEFQDPADWSGTPDGW